MSEEIIIEGLPEGQFQEPDPVPPLGHGGGAAGLAALMLIVLLAGGVLAAVFLI